LPFLLLKTLKGGEGTAEDAGVSWSSKKAFETGRPTSSRFFRKEGQAGVPRTAKDAAPGGQKRLITICGVWLPSLFEKMRLKER